MLGDNETHMMIFKKPISIHNICTYLHIYVKICIYMLHFYRSYNNIV